MKILYLYDNYPSYRKDFFKSLAEQLMSKGHEFLLFFGTKIENDSLQEKSEVFPMKSFPIQRMTMGTVNLMAFKGNFKECFRKEHPDVVVIQFHVALLSYWWAFFYMKKHHIPYIIWDCNYTRDNIGIFALKLRKGLVDFTFKKAAACISYGTVFRDYLIRLGKEKESVFVAQNTINVEAILEKRNSSCSMRNFDHPIRLLYVGALLGRKYVGPSIEAVSNLIDKGYDLYYDVVGNGEEFETLCALIKQKGKKNRIIMHGAKHGNDVQKFFENDDVFILPGTGGLAINEAMAYALPIISTVGDDTVVDLLNGNGYLLQNFGNVKEIESIIEKFILLSNREKQKMAERSEEIIKSKALLKNMVNQHVNAINHVIFKM